MTIRRKSSRSKGSSQPLQCLQIFNQIFLLLVGQLAANNALLVWRRLRCLERVAENRVAVDRRSIGCRRWEQGFAGFAFRGFPGDHPKASLLWIEVAGAHAEFCRTLGRGPEHPIERGNRTV